MRTTFISFLLLVICSPLASATDKGWSNIDGNTLLPRCSLAVEFQDKKDLKPDGVTDTVLCLDFVSGFLDGYETASTVENGKPMLCFPEGATTGQMIRVIVKWMQDHPEKLNEPASHLVFQALYNSFGCKYPK